MATILIADDMPVIREPIAMALKRAGHETFEASNGREALGILRGKVVDLLLLDIHMPEMTGIEALRKIRADPNLSDLPVILLTNESDRAIVLEARTLGVRHYFLKSAFSVDELFRRVNAILMRTSTRPPSTAQGPATDGNEDDTANDTALSGSNESHLAPIGHPGGSFSDPETELKERKPILKRSELAERLEDCGELKAMSPTVMQVIKLAGNSSASIEQIAKAIRRDHAIALKILRMGNSAAYASNDPVESVDKAVMRIGVKAIAQAVLNIAVVEHFSSDTARYGADPRLFWEHSIGCGIIAARIAAASECMEPDTAFTMGLLHDVGRCVYADLLGETYEAVLRTADELQLPLEIVEKRLLLLSHADGMDRILHQWNFPRDLVDPIVFHHLSLGNIRRMAPKRLHEVATIALANRLAHALMLGSSGNEAIYPTHEFCAALNLDTRIIDEIESKVPDETDDLKFAMLNAGASDSWPGARSSARERLGLPFRPLFVSAKPETDAFRMFCARLGDRTDEPPNIGIIHMTENRECSPLSDAFRQAESQAGASNLPLMILSPSGKLAVEQGLLADRRHECLPAPVAISRLLAGFGRLLEERASAKAA